MNADENRKEQLLTSLTSAMASLSSRKNQIQITKKIVERKNDECVEKLSNEEGIIVQMVRDKFTSLIKETKKQKAESGSRAGSQMTSLEEKIALLYNIKLNINKENLSQRDAIDYQETVDGIIKYTKLAPPYSFGFFE